MMYVATDLHGHTRYSDGRISPGQYVEYRRDLGMRVVAISDHDVMAGVPEGASAATARGMILLPATEVTGFLHFGTGRAEQFHILAYFRPAMAAAPRLRQTALFSRGQTVQRRWREFVLQWLDDLRVDDREAIDPDGTLGALRPEEFPALQPMIDRVVDRRRPLFERFRDHHVRFWCEDRELFGWEPEEIIDVIRADGAVDIVAHPARYRDKERTRSVLARATGLEVYTSRHKATVAAQFRAYAEEHGKHWTASADDHQNARYIRPPSGTPLRTVELLVGRPLTPAWLSRPPAVRRPAFATRA